MNIDRELKRHFIGRLIENDRRIDGRGFDDMRELKIQTNFVEKAEGSARVQLGNTDVLCGIKMNPGIPYPDNPNSGVMSTGAELCPIASPTFETGRPGEDAIELARVVDRGIRESGMIDFEKLCIEPGEKVWMVSIDIHVLNFDGNLLDACNLAAIAALNNTVVPKLDKKTGEVLREEKDYKLPVSKLPVSFTFVKIGEKIILDPVLDEEFAMDARLTVCVTEKSVHAMQKGGSGAFSLDEISALVDKAFSKYSGVKKLIK